MRYIRRIATRARALWRRLKAKAHRWFAQARKVLADCVDQLANDPGYVEAVRHVVNSGADLLTTDPRAAFVGDQLTTATAALLRITGSAGNPAPPPPVWD